MATVRLNGDASGYVELKAPNAAGSNSLILPNGNGSASQYLQTDGAGSLVWADPFRLTQGTAKDWNWNGLTTNTSIDFTGIPSWAKRITVMFSGVSTSGASQVIIQLGTGATPTYTASNYLGIAGATNFNSGFALDDIINSAGVRHGAGSILLLNSSTFVYAFSGSGGRSDSAAGQYAAGGSISLGAVVTAVRITTAGGTNFFDLGTINIMWEG